MRLQLLRSIDGKFITIDIEVNYVKQIGKGSKKQLGKEKQLKGNKTNKRAKAIKENIKAIKTISKGNKNQ